MNKLHNSEVVLEAVRTFWSSILEVPAEEVRQDSNFFETGGDSLRAVELAAAVSERLGIEAPLEPLLFDGTLGELVNACLAMLEAGAG